MYSGHLEYIIYVTRYKTRTNGENETRVRRKRQDEKGIIKYFHGSDSKSEKQFLRVNCVVYVKAK